VHHAPTSERDAAIHAIRRQLEFDLLKAVGEAVVLVHVVAKSLDDGSRQASRDCSRLGKEAHVAV